VVTAPTTGCCGASAAAGSATATSGGCCTTNAGIALSTKGAAGIAGISPGTTSPIGIAAGIGSAFTSPTLEPPAVPMFLGLSVLLALIPSDDVLVAVEVLLPPAAAAAVFCFTCSWIYDAVKRMRIACEVHDG
jgi:hypothetical protein